jgi:hypothetical protein
MMNTIQINGRIYNGNNVEIRNGVIKIDGVVQTDESAKDALEIRVLSGVIGQLDTDLSVNCGDVVGNVRAGGAVNCDDVGGHVIAGGSVNCDDVGGSVTASGSVNRG